jgi:hypothetical protein
MTLTQIKQLQREVGAFPDGFWGPKSIAACQAHLRRLMPSPHPWPAQSQAALAKFYGAAGDESRLINLDVSDLDVRYDGNRVKTVRCHGKVATSLRRVLVNLATFHPEVLRDYNGCYYNRPMRGGSLPSLHARGAAVDFCAATNGNKTHWPMRATMPLGVMEIFAAEGALAAGASWGRDAMHFQFTR